jgi:hypothetical protein
MKESSFSFSRCFVTIRCRNHLWNEMGYPPIKKIIIGKKKISWLKGEKNECKC